MEQGFKLSIIATSISLAAISLKPSAAMVVPNWAQTSRSLRVPVSSCKKSVQKAVQNITGSTGTADQLNGTTCLIMTYPRGTTGVFIYCVSNPEPACRNRISSVMLVAFSDRGSGEAAAWRDRLDRAIDSLQRIDCG